MKYFKLIVTVVLLFYFLSLAAQETPNTILWFVDTLMHEAGHWIYAVFGEFAAVLGGSFNQILIPVIFFGYFILKAQYYSASIVLFWVGENFLSVAAYANDAVVMQLPLLGGDGTIHDWNWLLSATGLLDHTNLIAGLIKIAGILCILTAGVMGIYFSFNNSEKENKLSDF